ncbi:unnamed protein product [Lactuca saligna]|uniref:DNA topoisomerase I catalytic core eukaryotic-type domain-containing protein n=1 Tax=Lactuca saligna TaxID=75948 RepID=A0AA36EKW1_LACSI|nr:unnamed protein product [Lactuca saligna]
MRNQFVFKQKLSAYHRRQEEWLTSAGGRRLVVGDGWKGADGVDERRQMKSSYTLWLSFRSWFCVLDYCFAGTFVPTQNISATARAPLLLTACIIIIRFFVSTQLRVSSSSSGIQDTREFQWNNVINGKDFKYVFLVANNALKGLSGKEKYEKARLLKGYIGGIRQAYTKYFTNKDLTKRQVEMATYLIDKLALRAGIEKVVLLSVTKWNSRFHSTKTLSHNLQISSRDEEGVNVFSGFIA